MAGTDEDGIERETAVTTPESESSGPSAISETAIASADSPSKDITDITDSDRDQQANESSPVPEKPEAEAPPAASLEAPDSSTKADEQPSLEALRPSGTDPDSRASETREGTEPSPQSAAATLEESAAGASAESPVRDESPPAAAPSSAEPAPETAAADPESGDATTVETQARPPAASTVSPETSAKPVSTEPEASSPTSDQAADPVKSPAPATTDAPGTPTTVDEAGQAESDAALKAAASPAAAATPLITPTVRRMTEATERAFKRGASGPRGAAEDTLVASVMFVADSIALGLGEQPISPWTELARVSLIKRAFSVIRRSGIESLWISASPSTHESIKVLGQEQGLELKFFNEFADMQLPEHGRVLIFDPCAIHDTASIQRLLKWRGGRVAIAVADEGDGLRVQIEGVRIREIGRDLVPFDALTAGAVSIPMELLEHFTEGSMLTVLRELADADLLGASLTPKSRSRELHLKRSLPDQENELLNSLAAPTDGLIDRLVNRKLSRAITAGLVASRISPWLIQAASLLIGISAGPLLALSGKVPIAPITAGALLWGSLLLERVAWELATLRLNLNASLRAFMSVTGWLVASSICLGIVLWFGNDSLLLLVCGLVVASKALGSVLSFRRSSQARVASETTWADRVDGLLNNRNEHFLLTPALLAIAILNLSHQDLARNFAIGGLAVSALIIFALNMALLYLSARPASED